MPSLKKNQTFARKLLPRDFRRKFEYKVVIRPKQHDNFYFRYVMISCATGFLEKTKRSAFSQVKPTLPDDWFGKSLLHSHVDTSLNLHF